MTGFRQWLRAVSLGFVSRVTRRHAVLLPVDAREGSAFLDVQSPYRVDGPELTIRIREPRPGRLAATLLGYEGCFPSRVVWKGDNGNYPGPCELALNTVSGEISLAGKPWGRAPWPMPGRRFCFRLELASDPGRIAARLTSHYLAESSHAPVGSSYYRGDNYVDHEAQSPGDTELVLDILSRYAARGPVLEVGCATGQLLAALRQMGLDSCGLDSSEWAVARARERVGSHNAWCCDVEVSPIPDTVRSRGPFGALVLASVLEHFREPYSVLKRLTPLASSGALLVLTTLNADSLSHVLLGREWEGYFDWTHRSVDIVSAMALRRELPQLGWRIERLETDRVWDLSADATRATFREWWAADARFRRFLAERDLGDLITCVAIKE